MKLEDLLTPDRVRIPMQATGLEAAVAELVGLLAEDAHLDADARDELAAGLASGQVGEVSALSPDAALAVARVPGAEELLAAIGVAPVPLTSESQELDSPRILLLVITPRRLSTLRAQIIPDLARAFRDDQVSQAVRQSGGAGDLASVRGLMGVALDEHLLVEDALSPVSYRVYPDTPMSEVLDLITRRGLHVVPVVGESYEVLGMITAAEALKYLLQQRRRGDGSAGDQASHGPTATARDVMSRTVMCVSEDQSLMEAANLMVNRDVAQLPVVREGELIGFLTRDTALQRLQR
jgi:CBS domain-containing protein